MPIIVPKNLPAFRTLRNENIFIMNKLRARHQDIRPLRIAIVNLMPNKVVTETQLIRMLANTPLQVTVHLLHMESHHCAHIGEEYLQAFYQTTDQIKTQKFDGMIITGAPVETLPFEEVDYWEEFTELMEYSKTNVYSTLHVCWGAQAGLYYHFGVPKYTLNHKLFGVFPHTINNPTCELLRGFDEEFYVPHSRNTQIATESLLNVPQLEILAESEKAGPNICTTHDLRQIFVQGHMEYDKDTLLEEYQRDREKGLDIQIPENYFSHNDPDDKIIVRWRSHANLFYSNWLNFIYQQTPYDINAIS